MGIATYRACAGYSSTIETLEGNTGFGGLKLHGNSIYSSIPRGRPAHIPPNTSTGSTVEGQKLGQLGPCRYIEMLQPYLGRFLVQLGAVLPSIERCRRPSSFESHAGLFLRMRICAKRSLADMYTVHCKLFGGVRFKQFSGNTCMTPHMPETP